jgi:hypothetical protein
VEGSVLIVIVRERESNTNRVIERKRVINREEDGNIDRVIERKRVI